jgi:hypothetical protein
MNVRETNKKEKKDILNSIKESVMQSPKTIYELSKELGSNWDTVRNNVNLLKNLGVVGVQDQKVIFAEKGTSKIDDATIAGLPVSEKIRKKVLALGKLFLNEWKANTNRRLSNTILQKALVEIADKFPKLNIPRGWYLYGKIVLVKVTEEILLKEEYKYDFSDEMAEVKQLKEEIKKLAKRYSTMMPAEVTKEQYVNNNSKMYLLRKEIESDLCFMEKSNYDALAKKLYELVFLFDLDNADEFSADVFAAFKDGITIMIEKIKNDKNSKELKAVLVDMFKSIWRLVANYNLYRTHEGDLGYDKLVIKSFMIEKSNFYKSEFLDQFAMA